MTWWASGNARTPLGHQAREARRLDRRVLGTADPGVGPAPAGGVIIARQIIVFGPNGGEFVYDATGNLRSANVGGVTTDPRQGLTCQQGFSTFNGHGAVINLLSTANGAFFQYQDLGTSTQGPLILVVASTSGTDPVDGTAYGAGMTGIDPAFGDSVVTVGANIGLNQVIYTRQSKIAAVTGSGAVQPKIQFDAPEQTTASHLQMWLAGASPDASKIAQLILAAVSGAGTLTPQTSALLEIQGRAAIIPPGGTKGEFWYPPSGDTTGATDPTVINSLLTAGHTVRLLTGTYNTNVPITPPTSAALIGPAHGLGIPGDSYGLGGLALPGAIIKPVAGFTGSAVILMDNSAHVTQAGNQAICGISIDGTSLPAGTVHGIQSIGSVAEVWIEDVTVYKTTGNGLFANIDAGSHPGDAWYILRSKFSNCGGYGVEMIGCGDTTIVATECANNTGGGNWHFRNLVNTRLIGCKAEWASAGPGYFVDWPSGGGGYMLFSGCTSEHNHSDGIFLGSIFNGGNLGTVILDGYKSRADGRNAALGGGSFAGIQAHGFPGRLIVNGSEVVTGIGLAGDAVSPQYGVSQIQGSYSVSLTGCFVNGTTAPIIDDGTNTIPLGWQAITPAAGFAAGSPSPRFKTSTADGGTTRLAGIISLTANQAAGTLAFTLPANTRPAQTQNLELRSNFGGGVSMLLDIFANGQALIQTAGSNGQVFTMDDQVFPLD